MKRIISIFLAATLIISCIIFAACGGGENTETTSPPSGEQLNEQKQGEEKASTSGSSLTWNDIPIYSGAKQVQKGSWSVPPADEDYSKVEWRYYEVSDSLEDIASFYRSNMPGKGWEEMGWMEKAKMEWGMYSKNNEQDAAMIWIGDAEGDAFLAIMRAIK